MFTPIISIAGKYEIKLELLKLEVEKNHLIKKNICKQFQQTNNYIDVRQQLESKVLLN